MSLPKISEQMKDPPRQRDVSVLVALSLSDMDKHAIRLDIGSLKISTFLESEAQGVDSGQTDLVVRHFDMC